MTKTFDKTYLTKELHLPHGEYVVSDTITDTGIWNIEHELIFKDPADNKYYRTSYRISATEMRLERPWEYDKTIEAVEVEKKLVIKEVYVAEDEQVQELSTTLDDTLTSILDKCKTDAASETVDMSHIEEIIKKHMSGQSLSQESVKTTDIDMEKFQKFCKKLRKKLNNIFNENETNLDNLPDSPAVDDVLEVYCENNKVLSGNKTLSYNLLELYQTYLENKKNQAYKPVEIIVDSIADDYEKRMIMKTVVRKWKLRKNRLTERESMSNNIRIYNENEPQYKLLQDFCDYLNAHTTDRYNFYLKNMLFDGGSNWYYTAIITEDNNIEEGSLLHIWQTCTPKTYETILQGEEYFNLAAHDVFEIHEWTNPPASSYDLTQVDEELGGYLKLQDNPESEKDEIELD